MASTTTKPDSAQPAAEMAVDLFDNWFDPIETEVRARAREFIEELIRGELDDALARSRYQRGKKAADEGRAAASGHRHGSRTRSLTGTFGPIEIAVPRARLKTAEGKMTEWKSQALRAYQRRTLAWLGLLLQQQNQQSYAWLSPPNCERSPGYGEQLVIQQSQRRRGAPTHPWPSYGRHRALNAASSVGRADAGRTLPQRFVKSCRRREHLRGNPPHRARRRRDEAVVPRDRGRPASSRRHHRARCIPHPIHSNGGSLKRALGVLLRKFGWSFGHSFASLRHRWLLCEFCLTASVAFV
jgi:hypothetical protein